jgi:hypothetical protein
MNMKWVIIGAILVVLLVAFGRNPVEEKRERAEREMQGKDPLIHAIEEHNKKGGTHSSFGGGGAIRPGMGSPQAIGTPSGLANPTPQNPYFDYRANPATPPTPAAPAARPAMPAQPQGGGYYPPPANQNMAPAAPLGAGQQRGFYLPNGQKLKFHGTNVYALTPDGRRMPLADGEYPVLGGKFRMLVRGGEKIDISAAPPAS